jgi:ABC-2 type transport system permease protein
MRQTTLILLTRFKIANNYVAGIRDHLVIHLFVFLGVVGLIVFGGMAFFYLLFHWLDSKEDFGALLMDRLITMVIMAFFSMLIFSNLIVTLSTTYISREIEYLMSQPVSHRSIFFVKLVESIFYSSWAFAILSLPLFMSFGIVREVSLWFYPLIGALVLPFLVIPAGLGALITMVLSAFLPARRALKWTIVLVAMATLLGVAAIRIAGAHTILFSPEISFSQVLNILKVGSTVWSPHYWFTAGMLALGRSDWKEFLYWLAMISSTALMLLQVCAWLAPPLYYRGWCLARETGSARGGAVPVGRALFDWVERRLRPLGSSTRALVMKDIKTFLRDPVQWSQLIILFGLLFIYVASLRSAYTRNYTFQTALPFWKGLISFFNMGATCFMLSILTTRLVYPMLSLEGKQFWVVGLAPMNRTRIVWEKYGMCWLLSVALTESLMFFSNWILKVTPYMMALSLSTLFLMSFGLTSLAVGLGAATPNFKEDNPARIANGVGGTLNVILSMFYIGLVVALEIYPAYLMSPSAGAMRNPHAEALLIASLVCLAFAHLVAIILPMRIGLKRWREMEF